GLTGGRRWRDPSARRLADRQSGVERRRVPRFGRGRGPVVDKEALKQAACRIVDQLAEPLIRTSDWMADHPELGLQEVEAARRLTGLLDEFGAEVERGIAGLPTAFAARLPGGRPGPRVALIAEYDALPDVGHGCGHNLIAT